MVKLDGLATGSDVLSRLLNSGIAVAHFLEGWLSHVVLFDWLCSQELRVGRNNGINANS